MASMQKKLAASVLKVGKSRVWLNPQKKADIDKAITKWDIRKLVKKGDIKSHPKKLKTPGLIKRRKGEGRRKGKKHSIVPQKRIWMSNVRAQRRMLKEMKDSSQLDNVNYRKLYRLVKGGMFRSRAHLRLYIDQNNMLKK
ncbi:MAG: 50S ribosomal protein L19e [Candidatus Aenigmarchaeota archaeon]|nr:50S ribosomal protein L19e [Candidatus Aenigmarchaeota archaeon]